MKILVTGVAGFIGHGTAKAFLQAGHTVYGIDNINNYYNINLKYDRLLDLGVARENCVAPSAFSRSVKYENFFFSKMNIESISDLAYVFSKVEFDIVIHLAAQAGVRYSIENPRTYIDVNIFGFFNILECCREFNIKRLLYASSSSIYGNIDNKVFTETDDTSKPVSIYAATKKSNELFAHTYSSLYGMKTVGLRFFTVYGPWGRPDMAPFLFSDAICTLRKIQVFNSGFMKRDFTFIDDVVNAILTISFSNIDSNYSVLNIGNSNPINIIKFINELELNFGRKANLEFCDMQQGDVVSTWADISELREKYNFTPKISIDIGVKKFVEWYKYYNSIK